MPDATSLPPWIAWVQAAGWLGGTVAAAVALWRGLVEVRLSRELRARELLWKQSSAAAESLDAMEDDELAAHAMQMLDFDGRNYQIKGGVKYFVDYKARDRALELKREDYTNLEIYVRDCFDHLLYHLNRFQHHIDIEIIQKRDIEFPVKYLTERMADSRSVFKNFMREYRYEKALKLVEDFWAASSQAPSQK